MRVVPLRVARFRKFWRFQVSIFLHFHGHSGALRALLGRCAVGGGALRALLDRWAVGGGALRALLGWCTAWYSTTCIAQHADSDRTVGLSADCQTVGLSDSTMLQRCSTPTLVNKVLSIIAPMHGRKGSMPKYCWFSQ